MALAFIWIMKNKAFDILKHNYDHLLLCSGGQQQRLGQNGHVYKYTRLRCMPCLFLKDSDHKTSTHTKYTINSHTTGTL